MNEPLSFQAARTELATGLKAVLSAHESKIATLRARELKKSTGNKLLSKNDLCLLCGNAPKSCACLRKAEGGTCTSCSRPITGPRAADNTVCGFCKAKPPKAKKDEGDLSLNERCASELGKNDDKMATLFGKEPKKKDVLPKGAYPKNATARPGSGGACSECGVVGHKPSEHSTKKSDDEGARDCPSCGTANSAMGGLGTRTHYRCRDCGSNYSHAPEKAPVSRTAKLMDAAKQLGVLTHVTVGDKTKKDELPIVKPAPEKTASGAKLPGTPKKQDLGEGSGDATKLGKRELRKDMSGGMPKKPGTVTLPGMAKPAGAAAPVVGVPGKQPVGQGGGDAFKVPQAAPPTPVAQVNKELAGAKSVAGRPMPGMGAPVVGAPKVGAPVGNNLKPVAGSFMARKDEMSDQLNSDKRAGGVGWLNNLHATLTAPKPKAPPQDVMLVRDKMNLQKPVATAAKAQSAGPVLSRPSPRAGITGAAALARGEKSPAKKMEGAGGPPPDAGLNANNHSRRLLVIKTGGRR